MPCVIVCCATAASISPDTFRERVDMRSAFSVRQCQPSACNGLHHRFCSTSGAGILSAARDLGSKRSVIQRPPACSQPNHPDFIADKSSGITRHKIHRMNHKSGSSAGACRSGGMMPIHGVDIWRRSESNARHDEALLRLHGR